MHRPTRWANASSISLPRSPDLRLTCCAMRIGWRSPWRTASSKGKQPKLTAREHAYLPGTHNGAERSIAELAELLYVSRVTIYRALDRARAGMA